MPASLPHCQYLPAGHNIASAVLTAHFEPAGHVKQVEVTLGKISGVKS